MSDREILTLALIMDYLPFLGETQFIEFIRANYGSWFPNLLDRRGLMPPKAIANFPNPARQSVLIAEASRKTGITK